MQEAVIEQRLHQERYAANLEHVFGDITAARFQIRDIRCLFEDFGHVEQRELDPAFVRDGRQVQRRIGRAARGRDGRSRVFQRLARDDVARAQVHLDQIHDLLARRHAEAVADLVRRRRARRIGKRQTDRLGDRSPSCWR
jgi:hypothetical protein